MKHESFKVLMLLLIFVVFGCEDDPEKVDIEPKTIEISNSVYGDQYPAVWFSPSTGEYVPVGDPDDPNIETPPETKFRFWLEPRDPEFCDFTAKSTVLLVGNGPSYFTDQVTKSDNRPSYCVESIEIDNVFYFTTPDGDCFIQIVEYDQLNNYLKFLWKAKQ